MRRRVVGGQNAKIRVAVFGSGMGTNARALLEYSRNEAVAYQIVLIVSNRAEAGILAVAQQFGVRNCVLSPRNFATLEEYVTALHKVLDESAVEFIALAGYLLKVPATTVQRYPGRIVNIHPALLPKFGGKGMYGLNVHRAVLDKGEHCTGITVHVVTEEYDAGQIIEQVHIPVLLSDTAESLMQRVQEAEHHYYPRALDRLCRKLVFPAG